MNKYLLFFLFVSWTNLIQAQYCASIGPQTIFWTQEDIDSFSTNYPGVRHFDGSLSICGEAITNLRGLNQLESVEGHFQIAGTSVTNLEGLENLSYIKAALFISYNDFLEDVDELSQLEEIQYGLSIENNALLSSLSGLEQVSFPVLWSTVRIINCPNLQECSIESLCTFLGSYHSYLVGNNGLGCNNRAEITTACSLPLDTTARQLILADGFENWTDSIPGSWEGEVRTSNGERNIEIVPALIEQNSSLLLRSNIPSFEGPESTSVLRKLYTQDALIDVSFTYRCTGVGSCHLNLGQMIAGATGSNYRNVWSVVAGDTTQRTVLLQNIRINPPFDFFSFIAFEASPVWTPSGSNGISEFVVDDLHVTRKAIVSNATNYIEDNIRVYPNPAISQLRVEGIENVDSILIFDRMGKQVLSPASTSFIDISHLEVGLYFLLFRKNGKSIYRKFVKN